MSTEMDICTGPDCTRPAADLCKAHRQQLDRRGRRSLLTPIRKAVVAGTQCAGPDCDRAAVGSHNLCHAHYKQLWKRRDMVLLTPLVPPASGIRRGERQRRLAAVRAGAAAGLTVGQVAVELGVLPATFATWVARHVPDHGLRSGRCLPAAEEARRAAAVRAGRAAGLSSVQIAAGLGLCPDALRAWLRRHGDGDPATEPELEPERGPVDLWVAVTVGAGGWLVTCGPCARRFTRPERRRAEWLAAMHARMHGLTITARDRTGTRYEAADVAVA